MSVNQDRALVLINVIRGAAELGPKEANSISALAAMELRAMDDEARKEVAERNTKAQAEAAAKAAEEAEARAAHEAEDGETTYSDDGPKVIPSNSPTLAERRV